MKAINYFLGYSETAIDPTDAPVFKVRYADNDANSSPVKENELSVAMSSASQKVDFCENWWAGRGVAMQSGSIVDGDLRYIDFGEDVIVFGKLGAIQDMEASVNRAYTEMFRFLQDNGFKTLIRSWNFIPGINEVPQGEIERYRAFCAGRAKAYESHHFSEKSMPAATGIGSHANDVLGYTIASKNCRYGHVENPLQTPAYRYPSRYGPKSPSFARGTVLKDENRTGALRTIFFLSGTASIRNSQTIGEGDLKEQIGIMMENVESLLTEDNLLNSNGVHPLSLKDFDHFKVYFKNASDYPTICEILSNEWDLNTQKLFFMNVDICRDDLLIEIEGCINPDIPVAG